MRTRRLFTIGYEGRTLAQLVDDLRSKRVSRVVDIRALPLSRRRGFSKTPLRAALAEVGIDYIHVRAAGNPFRHLQPDVRACLAAYKVWLATMPAIVDEVRRATTGRRSALLCVERDPSCCHRSVLGARMIEGHRIALDDL